MMWTRHQLAPAVPMQKVVDRAVAGRMTDGFLVSRLEIMDVQHFAGAGRFCKTRQQRLFFGHRHVLVLASTIWPGLERLDTCLTIGHVSAVHRTQRHPHRSRNRRLRHPALTQQHHLDALALRRRHLPSHASLRPPYLGLAAFDHPFPRIRWSKRITPQARNTARPGSLLHYPNRTDSRPYGAGISLAGGATDRVALHRTRRCRMALSKASMRGCAMSASTCACSRSCGIAIGARSSL